MENREFRVLPTEVRIRRDDGKVGLEGVGILYESRVDLGPFEEEIAAGAAKSALARSDIRGLFNHDPNFVLGRTKSGTMTVKDGADGVSYHIPDLPSTRQDVAESIDRGDVDGNSFSFTVKTDQWTSREDGKDLRRILEFDQIFDIGPVTFPAYPDTTVALRSRDAALGPVVKTPADAVADLQARKDKLAVIAADL